MKLTDYTWEIFDIAGANGVDIGVGRDMFLVNLRNAEEEGARRYPGAEDVDFVALGKEWQAMSETEQLDELGVYRELTSLHGKYFELCDRYREGDREGFDAVIAGFLNE